MTARENELPRSDLTNSLPGTQENRGSTPLISSKAIWSRLKRGPEVRARFVESNLGKLLAFQIRGMRDRQGLSQVELAERIGTNQNGVSRLENPFYGKATLSTLKRVAAAFDVGLVVRFVSFSQLADLVSATSPEIVNGPVSFAREEARSNLILGKLNEKPEREVRMFPKQLGSISMDSGSRLGIGLESQKSA
jgi:transcriptional regulator with XRE-family HTH domain